MASTTSYANGRLRPARWRLARLAPALLERAWLLWTALLSGLLILLTGRNLSSFPNVSGDDAWIMSASHKLAREGVFGSDMFRGFANADQHYFIALPVYHLLQAGVFLAFGTSVAAARAVTLASGLVALWCVAWLARRWFGPGVAIVAVGLLVVWRSYLVTVADGLAFISVARTGRYDMTAVALVLLTLVGLEHMRGSERRVPALLTGVVAGLATLTQFFGAFTVPLIAAVLLAEHGRGALRARATRWVAAGWLLLVLPYAGYVLAHWSEFRGQSELKAGRIEFDSPGFYPDNLLSEPERYRHLFEYLSPALERRYDHLAAPLSPFLFGAAALVALGMLALRLRSDPTPGERRLALALAVLGLALGLFDATKATLYAVLLLPPLSIAIALLLVRTVRWLAARQSIPARVAGLALLLTPLAFVVDEGIAMHREEYRQAGDIVGYEDVSRELDALLPRGAPVLGMERWWAGLHAEHEYLALAAALRQLDASGEAWDAADLRALFDRYRIGALIVDDNVRGTLQSLPPPQRDAFERFTQEQTRHAGSVAVHPYGRIDVYVLAESGAP